MLFKMLKKVDSTYVEDPYVAAHSTKEIKQYANNVTSRLTRLGRALEDQEDKQQFSKFIGSTIASTIIMLGAFYIIGYLIVIKGMIWLYSHAFHAMMK